MIGYIILAVSVLALIAALVFIFIKSSLPPYKDKKSGSFGGFKATVWAQNSDLLSKYDANDVAKAAYALASVWSFKSKLAHPEKATSTLKEVGVLLTTKEGFQRWGYFSPSIVASVQLWTKDKIYNKRFPLIVVHEGTLDRMLSSTGNAMNRGQPVIHELIHAVMDEVYKSADAKHIDEDVWENTKDDRLQVEEEAMKVYQKDL